MGHKVHPKIFRINTTKNWDSRWFSRKNYKKNLQEDILIRDFLKKELFDAGVDRIEIERSPKKLTVLVHSSKPGFIIGRAGAGVEELKKKVKDNYFRGKRVNLEINVQEVSKPNLSAAIVASQIVTDVQKRMPYRRVMKQTLDRVMKAGAKGVKVCLSGRLNGVEIARSETLSDGKIPLQNLRADIDYCQTIARTIYGAIGVKVWVYRGDVFESENKKKQK